MAIISKSEDWNILVFEILKKKQNKERICMQNGVTAGNRFLGHNKYLREFRSLQALATRKPKANVSVRMLSPGLVFVMNF